MILRKNAKRKIGPANLVREGRSVKFVFRKGKDREEGFLIRRKGKLYAYVNRCRHVSLPLDFGDNDFFTEDGRYLLCKNHGALYAPETGLCVAGPCAGDSLEALPVRVEGADIYYDGTEDLSGFRLGV